MRFAPINIKNRVALYFWNIVRQQQGGEVLGEMINTQTLGNIPTSSPFHRWQILIWRSEASISKHISAVPILWKSAIHASVGSKAIQISMKVCILPIAISILNIYASVPNIWSKPIFGLLMHVSAVRANVVKSGFVRILANWIRGLWWVWEC